MLQPLSLFREFFKSEKASGFILIACTIISLLIANSEWGAAYDGLFDSHLDLSFGDIQLDYSMGHWINDGLMAVFFLLVGLEIERELYIGELSNIKNASLPIVAAIGGVLMPAGIHLAFNAGTATAPGFGIPMATDIAFALGILSLAGNRVPLSLKIFLTALAIIDDLFAIVIIAVFYTKGFSPAYFATAIGIFALLLVFGKWRIHSLLIYLPAGVILWYCMLKSGVHASISGVLLAFAVPFRRQNTENPSYKLQHYLHYPVAFIVLPLFALANTAIPIPANAIKSLSSVNSLGIILGLVAGKFLGIMIASYIAIKGKVGALPADISWRMLMGVACLGGIGFTMSIFITNLAFNHASTIVSSKLSILVASCTAAILGLLVLSIKGDTKSNIEKISQQ